MIEVERYFMLIPEACQLVLQACAMGRDGQVMVLDMGTPVKIADVAQTLIEISGKHIDVVYTGLRPGEKLTEVLFTEGEDRCNTDHDLVDAVFVPPLTGTSIDLSRFATSGEAIAVMSTTAGAGSRPTLGSLK